MSIQIKLNKKEVLYLEAQKRTGNLSLRKYNRINILLLLSKGKKNVEIEDFLGVDRITIWRTKTRYLEQGIENALEEEARSGQPKKYSTDHEAELAVLACGPCPEGRKRWTVRLLTETLKSKPGFETINRESVRLALKKNECKPWLKKMWCIQEITPEYRERMYRLLDLYKEEYDPVRPVICMDEKSKQLLEDNRRPIIAKPGSLEKYDYEYKRKGTCNIFMAVNPKGGIRIAKVTATRKKPDFAHFIKELSEIHFPKAKYIQIVLDNLNTHFESSMLETFGERKTKQIMKKIRFIHTPKHASWLNMAEIEINIMDRQCIGDRISSKEELETKLAKWTDERNKNNCTIEWKFTRQDADKKLSKHYVT